MSNNTVKMIIAGSRGFSDYELLVSEVKKAIKKCGVTTIISGHADGADKLGEAAAKELGLELEIYPADWKKFGKAAGYRRNEQMAAIADILLAFWDEESKGTAHMIRVFAGSKKVIRFNPATQPKVQKAVKYYAVVRGHNPGVYESWFGKGGAKEQVEGFDRSFCKKFETASEAEVFLQKELDRRANHIAEPQEVELQEVASVMEVCVSGKMQAGVGTWTFFVGPHKETGEISGDGVKITAMAAEMAAIMHAVQYAKHQGARKLHISCRNESCGSVLNGGKPSAASSKKYAAWMKNRINEGMVFEFVKR